MIIAFGALAEPLTEQLKGMVQEEELQRLQMDADAINRLYIRSLLTSAETEKARTRLAKAIQKQIDKQ